MISYLGSLDQFSPAVGRAGRCRQMSLCVGSTRRALARQPAVLAPSPRVLRAFSLRRAARAARDLRALSPGAVRPFPPRPQRAPPVGSQEVFRQEPGPVCGVGGGGFSGAEFAPFPSPCLLPPAGMGRLFSPSLLIYLLQIPFLWNPNIADSNNTGLNCVNPLIWGFFFSKYIGRQALPEASGWAQSLPGPLRLGLSHLSMDPTEMHNLSSQYFVPFLDTMPRQARDVARFQMKTASLNSLYPLSISKMILHQIFKKINIAQFL